MKEFNKLVRIMKKLRNPKKGCPWDLKQSEKTLKEYILEEAYELIEAIDAESSIRQKEELGDLLLQVVFLSQVNKEKNNFSIRDVIASINQKLINRHPHIFSKLKVSSADEVRSNWDKIKKAEKGNHSFISDYPERMPALLIAKRIAEQASSVGFDWQDSSELKKNGGKISRSAAEQSLDKISEEVEELKSELLQFKGGNSEKTDRIMEEIGDILFAVSNVARLLNINPEFALKKTNDKFKYRFRFIEQQLRGQGKDIQQVSLEEMEDLWQQAKNSKPETQ